jgi:uncharacterized Rmd1/YagE family protein
MTYFYCFFIEFGVGFSWDLRSSFFTEIFVVISLERILKVKRIQNHEKKMHFHEIRSKKTIFMEMHIYFRDSDCIFKNP